MLSSRFNLQAAKWLEHQRMLAICDTIVRERLSHELGVDISQLTRHLGLEYRLNNNQISTVVDLIVNSKYVEVDAGLLFLKPRCQVVDAPHSYIDQDKYIE